MLLTVQIPHLYMSLGVSSTRLFSCLCLSPIHILHLFDIMCILLLRFLGVYSFPPFMRSISPYGSFGGHSFDCCSISIASVLFVSCSFFCFSRCVFFGLFVFPRASSLFVVVLGLLVALVFVCLFVFRLLFWNVFPR